MSKEGRVVALLTEGESFGETVLYHERAKRTATVITRSYCQLFMLSKNAVSTALATSPEAYRKLKEHARALYREHMAESGENGQLPSNVFGTIDGTTRKSSFGGQPGIGIDVDNLRRSVERADAMSVAKLTEEMATIKALLVQLLQNGDDRSAFDGEFNEEEEEFVDPDSESPGAPQITRQRSIMKQSSARLTQSPSKKQVFFE